MFCLDLSGRLSCFICGPETGIAVYCLFILANDTAAKSYPYHYHRNLLFWRDFIRDDSTGSTEKIRATIREIVLLPVLVFHVNDKP
jgi:hypothetical protein